MVCIETFKLKTIPLSLSTAAAGAEAADATAVVAAVDPSADAAAVRADWRLATSPK